MKIVLRTATRVLRFNGRFHHHGKSDRAARFSTLKTVSLYFIKILMKAHIYIYTLNVYEMLRRRAALARFILWLYFSTTTLNSLPRSAGTWNRAYGSAANRARIISEISCNARNWEPTQSRSIDPLRARLTIDTLFAEIILLYYRDININLLILPHAHTDLISSKTKQYCRVKLMIRLFITPIVLCRGALIK